MSDSENHWSDEPGCAAKLIEAIGVIIRDTCGKAKIAELYGRIIVHAHAEQILVRLQGLAKITRSTKVWPRVMNK